MKDIFTKSPIEVNLYLVSILPRPRLELCKGQNEFQKRSKTYPQVIQTRWSPATADTVVLIHQANKPGEETSERLEDQEKDEEKEAGEQEVFVPEKNDSAPSSYT